MKITFRRFLKSDYQDYHRIFSHFSVDLKKISSQEYRSTLRNRGFLVGNPPEIDRLQRAPFFQCALINNRIVGFIRGDRLEKNRHENTDLFHNSSLIWLESGQDRYYFEHQDGLEMGVIMVDRDFLHQGIGGQLLNTLLEFAKERKILYLYSWVATSPANRPSLCFHQNKGFVQIATFTAEEAFGIPQYQSHLLCIKPSPPLSNVNGMQSQDM